MAHGVQHSVRLFAVLNTIIRHIMSGITYSYYQFLLQVIVNTDRASLSGYIPQPIWLLQLHYWLIRDPVVRVNYRIA